MGILNVLGCALTGTIAKARPIAASLQTSCRVVVPARNVSSLLRNAKSLKSLLSLITRAGHESVELPHARRFCSFGLLGTIAARQYKTTISTALCSKCIISRTVLKNTFNNRSLTTKVNQNIANDVLVYSHLNDKFYKVLAGFGLFQMVIWGYFSLFAVQNLKASPTPNIDTSDLPWWKYLLYKEGQYKNALSILCFSLGGIVLFMTMAYPRRAVRNLWLLRGGSEIQITTYSWLGKTQTFKKPLEHISFMQSRTGSGHHIPFKIKGKPFYYLIDKQGSFHNNDLFDFVIGFKRNF
ncbi:hypothetical protein BsWGS_14974 [Bradybaena similaris]